MRYRGQGHEIAVPLPTDPYAAADAATLRAAFEDTYRRLYSRIIPGVEIELLSWVLLLSAPPPSNPPPRRHRPLPSTPEPARHRPVFDPDAGEFVLVAIHDRQSLRPGAPIPGPAIRRRPNLDRRHRPVRCRPSTASATSS